MKNEYMGKRNKSKESGNTSQKRILKKKKKRERDILILQMVIAAMKLKDTYSLEGKL